MRALPSAAFWLVAPLALALWLLVATPSRWLGIDAGTLGAALMLATAWVGLWLASRIPDDEASALSPGEQKNWVALAFTGLVGMLMVLKADAFLNAESVADLKDFGRPLVMLLIGWIILGALLRNRFGPRIQQDERDMHVERIADSSAHTTLCIAIVAIAVTLGFTPRARIDGLSPLALANLLMFALVFASFVGHVVAAWRYRRDRA